MSIILTENVILKMMRMSRDEILVTLGEIVVEAKTEYVENNPVGVDGVCDELIKLRDERVEALESLSEALLLFRE